MVVLVLGEPLVGERDWQCINEYVSAGCTGQLIAGCACDLVACRMGIANAMAGAIGRALGHVMAPVLFRQYLVHSNDLATRSIARRWAYCWRHQHSPALPLACHHQVLSCHPHVYQQQLPQFLAPQAMHHHSHILPPSCLSSQRSLSQLSRFEPCSHSNSCRGESRGVRKQTRGQGNAYTG